MCFYFFSPVHLDSTDECAAKNYRPRGPAADGRIAIIVENRTARHDGERARNPNHRIPTRPNVGDRVGAGVISKFEMINTQSSVY